LFIHEFVSINNKAKRNKIIGIITILILLFNYSISSFPKIFTSDITRIFIKDMVFIIVILYNFSLLIIKYKNESITESKVKLFKFIILFGVSLPCIISDTFFLEEIGFKLFPLIYIVFGAYFLNYFLSINRSYTIYNKVENIKSELQNRYMLTEREVDVALLLIKGASYKEIAEKLYISINTVKSHLQNIYQKTEVSNKMQLLNKLSK
ncbi:MAG TPA: helix-turn-helix transcriptional regulator, partial [Melioribacteraceae bacterium]|nr:helix-turn-helix transcriptional regulator [Melioribacteraceae bacterium]